MVNVDTILDLNQTVFGEFQIWKVHLVSILIYFTDVDVSRMSFNELWSTQLSFDHLSTIFSFTCRRI